MHSLHESPRLIRQDPHIVTTRRIAVRRGTKFSSPNRESRPTHTWNESGNSTLQRKAKRSQRQEKRNLLMGTPFGRKSYVSTRQCYPRNAYTDRERLFSSRFVDRPLCCLLITSTFLFTALRHTKKLSVKQSPYKSTKCTWILLSRETLFSVCGVPPDAAPSRRRRKV